MSVGKSENYAASVARLNAGAAGFWLTRNNVGVLVNPSGRPVRYGLYNESADQNKRMKSGDLIGIRRVLITPEMVGGFIGQFASVETKRPGWTFNPNDPHEVAQKDWADFVNAKGGYAVFSTGEL